MNDEITYHHAMSLSINRWLPSGMPYKAKTRTETRSCTADKPSIMSQRTISLPLKARASKEVGSLSAPNAALSGLNRMAP